MKKNYFSLIINNALLFLKLSHKIKSKWFSFILFFVFVNFSFGQIVQRGTATTSTATLATITINKPTGVVQNDVMIVVIAKQGNTGNPSLTGWTLIDGEDLGGQQTNRNGAVLYKVAGASEPGSYTFTLGSSTSYVAATIIAFSGVDVSGATPFDVAPSAISVQDSQTVVNATARTTVSPNAAIIMCGMAAGSNRSWSNWSTATSPGALTEIADIGLGNNNDGVSVGAAWAIKPLAGSTGTGSATLNGSERNGGILIALKKALPTITGFGANSGCAGGTITINGTNLSGATAANVRIGGTAVSSITSNTATQIVAIIGSGTTGTVTVTNSAGTATSATSFTVNPQPTASSAGPDQANAAATSFTLAANTPTSGTGLWTIVSGPNTNLAQFSSTTNPMATFSPLPAGTYVLNWAISNGTCSSSDQVVVTNNCITNMITNGDFSNGASGWGFAAIPGSDRVEVNSENTYFNNGNSSLTAELDIEASLRQSIAVIPGVSYTVSFRYARRDDIITPATTGVTVRVTGGTPTTSPLAFTTTNRISQIGSVTFTATTTSVAIEFYNHLSTANQTYGTIIDDIVLLPASQANPYAVTNPRGSFNTTTACAGVAVQLDVENAPASGATYLWTGTAGAVFSSTTSKIPTVTFSGSGLQQATVTVTSASGCPVTSTTYVNVTAAPTITAPIASSICSGSTYSSGSITSTGVTYDWSRAGFVGINGGAANSGQTNIINATGFNEVLTNSTSAPINVTYVLIPKSPLYTCNGIPYNLVITVNPRPTISNMTPSSCSTVGFSATPVNGTNGVVPAGTTYSWPAPSVAGITGTASGTNATSISGTLTNTTNAAINVVYTVTPTSGSCTGSTFTVTVTVNPRPTISNMTPSSCSTVGFSATPVNGTNGVVPAGTTYSWPAPSVAGITGTASGTNATSISGTLINTTNAAINVVYTVTPTSGSCTGSTFTVTVTVNPRPSISNMTPSSCSTVGFSTTPVNGTNGVVPTGTTYSWPAPSVAGITGAASGANATSISGTLINTTNAAINVVYTVTPTSGSCTGSTFTVTVTVNPRPTISNMTPSSCSNVGFSATPVNGTNGVVPAGTTYSWSAPSVTGITGTASGTNATSISGTLTNITNAAIDVVYTVTPTSSSCTGSTFTVTVTVNTVNTPSTSVTVQPNCSLLTGSITLRGLPTSGTINQTVNNVTTNFPVSQVGGNQTITDLAAGSYTFTVSSGGCTSGASTPVTVVAFSGVIAKWNGSAWSPSVPTTNDRVEFLTSYSSGNTIPSSPANVDACSCYVKNSAVVVFNPGHTLNVINEVVVESGGSLTFENNASLVQVNDAAVNSGNIIYKRITAAVNRYDYTYWSSPVVGMTLGLPSVGLSPTTFFDKYFIYNNAWFSVPRSTVMIKGKGYIVRAPQSYNTNGPAQTYLATFTGVPHNGLFTLSGLAASQAHLLGNPYPSAIDADVFLNLNSKLSDAEGLRVLEGTLYFWTHNTPPSTAISGDKKYNYTANDYATYNRTGGTATAAKVHPLNYPAGVGSTNFSIPTGKIAAGQGFFAPTKAGGDVVFNNAMRISGGGVNGTNGGIGTNNAQFFKLSSGKTATTTVAKTEKNRIWLNLTNSEGAFKQTLVGYITGATNDYDGAFDGVTYNGNVFVDFYSVNNEVSLAIQGRALPFVKKDSVALGYRSTIIGDFQISIDQTDGVLSNQNVFLEDKDLKVLHDLKKEGYTFSTEKGTFNNRFVLRYVDKNAVDEVIPEVSDELNKAIVVALNKNEITIKTDIATIDKVFIYDSAGKKLYQKNKVDAHVFVISHLISSHQVLVVDVVLSDGTKHSKKIIY